jgi:glycosyltransferase involved in cell wall biosynthesis
MISLILPTLNEAEGLRWFLTELKKLETPLEVIVADGHSTDGTLDVCREFGHTGFTQTGLGVPGASNEALSFCHGDTIVVASPDGNCIPLDIFRLAYEIDQGYDVVVGSRYLPPAKSLDDDILTSLGNFCFSKLMSLLFRRTCTDALTCFRAYRRDAISRLRLAEPTVVGKLHYIGNGWEIPSFCRAVKLGLKIKEISTIEPERLYGSRKMRVVRNGLMALAQILYEWAVFSRKGTI